jgi:hypothetical protein
MHYELRYCIDVYLISATDILTREGERHTTNWIGDIRASIPVRILSKKGSGPCRASSQVYLIYSLLSILTILFCLSCSSVHSSINLERKRFKSGLFEISSIIENLLKK